MSHVISCSIEGLAGKKEVLNINFNRNINILFGLNGSGKTSLLRILQSAMSNEPLILQNIPFKRAEVRIYSIAANKEFTLATEVQSVQKEPKYFDDEFREVFLNGNYTIVRQDSSRQIKYRWAIKPKVEKGSGLEKHSGKWKHIYLPTSRIYINEHSARSFATPNSAVLTEEQLEQFYDASLQSLWARYSREVSIQVRKAQEEGLANILKAVLSPQTSRAKDTNPVDPEIAYRSADAFLRRQGSPKAIGDYKTFLRHYAKDDRLKSVVNDINEVERKIESAVEPRNRLQNLISSMFTGNKSIEFLETGVVIRSSETSSSLSLNLLSSGEKHLLRIFIEALNASESTCIIDEPELSLHIDWQRHLVSSLRLLNPESQYILATHSPEIMADVDDDKVFRI